MPRKIIILIEKNLIKKAHCEHKNKLNLFKHKKYIKNEFICVFVIVINFQILRANKSNLFLSGGIIWGHYFNFDQSRYKII